MRFTCLGSGSRGNAWLVEAGGTRVLIDCGFGPREMARRLARRGVAADTVQAVVLTHEHGDHAQGALRFAARYDTQLWMTAGCSDMLALDETHRARLHRVLAQRPFAIGALHFTPYALPHDAREPVHYVVSDGRVRLGMLSDAGHVDANMLARLSGCDALVLECNHDRQMLQQGRYPGWLKARILGPQGHLDNAAAAELLRRIDTRRLRHVVAAHLSAENNTPQRARAALASALDCRPDEIAVADQDAGLDWCSL
ncbi:MAG: MBL fold metallo-hydrolase [Thiobacillaceae bacterium]|nr:MBL fold metallo-hydrolase [Thiobacillaceae bacterium]MCX7673173.1 MBL fold metallo-hydrolase [Thiobacillaceae bacterium]MDW8322756.1 MBL fold metallo-hydrolase [Burkholderiales bacterium]